jgi:hypothetical protein
MTDRRVAPRLKTLLTGRCLFDGHAFDCSIVNISLSGARLAFGFPVGIPDRFRLHIGGKDNVYHATVAWRRGLEVGVSFDHAAAAEPHGRTADAPSEPARPGTSGLGQRHPLA